MRDLRRKETARKKEQYKEKDHLFMDSLVPILYALEPISPHPLTGNSTQRPVAFPVGYRE
jgi:hypothetical protein